MNDYLLQKLTIVIFSYNRHIYLKRSIKYWSSYNVKVIALDGSDIRLQDPCLNFKNIKYIHDPRSLYDRLLNSINYIDTDYMILGSDDEFYLPSALSSCIEFLTKEISFASCGGRAIGFRTREQGKKIFGNEQYPKLRNLCLDQDDASKRAYKHFSNYTPAHIYSVMRTSKWKIICKHVFKKEYNFFAVWELQIEFLVTISGKSKIIPELMWLRSFDAKPIRMTNPVMSDEVKITYWWFNKKFKNEKKDFLNRMKKACNALIIDQNLEYSYDIIVRPFEAYIQTIKSKETFLRKIRKHIPSKIKIFKRYLEQFMDKLKSSKYKSLAEEINLLEAEGVFVSHKDINKITSLLKNKNNKPKN